MTPICVDSQACPDCGGIGQDDNACFWCHRCRGTGSVGARLRHYEVLSPDVSRTSWYEPPDVFRCWGIYLAPNAKTARVMAVKDVEFREWVDEVRGYHPPFKGLTTSLCLCEHGRCWACDDDGEGGTASEECVDEWEAHSLAELTT